jgi:hypothetical protein
MLILSSPKLNMGQRFSFDVNLDAIAALLFLLLLSLELADKVTMKRDLEIAREIQSWLTPSQPPPVTGASIAFHTRPQNSVAGDYYDAFYPLQDAESGAADGNFSSQFAHGGAGGCFTAKAGGPAEPLCLRTQSGRAEIHYGDAGRIRSGDADTYLRQCRT